MSVVGNFVTVEESGGDVKSEVAWFGRQERLWEWSGDRTELGEDMRVMPEGTVRDERVELVEVYEAAVQIGGDGRVVVWHDIDCGGLFAEDGLWTHEPLDVVVREMRGMLVVWSVACQE